MELLGYSERGLLNGFFYECYHSPRAPELVRGFLRRAHWPGGSAPPVAAAGCKLVLLEQSFSDFGDADVVLALQGASAPFCVFCEGKRGRDGRLATQWRRFNKAYQGDVRDGLSSNLISQLYLKQRFVAALAAGEDIRGGLDFDGPLSLQTRKRKIGSNPVVLDAVERVRPFAAQAYFLMLIPCSDAQQAGQDFAAIQQFATPPRDWDLARWGFVTIQDLEEYCETEGLRHTVSICRFNHGQLY